MAHQCFSVSGPAALSTSAPVNVIAPAAIPPSTAAAASPSAIHRSNPASNTSLTRSASTASKRSLSARKSAASASKASYSRVSRLVATVVHLMIHQFSLPPSQFSPPVKSSYWLALAKAALGTSIPRPSAALFAFAQRVISNSKLSLPVILVALKYVETFLVALRTQPAGTSNRPPGTPPLLDLRLDTAVEFNVLLGALMAANKFLDDSRYSNRWWAKVAEMPIPRVNHVEMAFLDGLSFRLHIHEDTYVGWVRSLQKLAGWLEEESMSTAAASDGAVAIKALVQPTLPNVPAVHLQPSPSPVAVCAIPVPAPSPIPSPYLLSNNPPSSHFVNDAMSISPVTFVPPLNGLGGNAQVIPVPLSPASSRHSGMASPHSANGYSSSISRASPLGFSKAFLQPSSSPRMRGPYSSSPHQDPTPLRPDSSAARKKRADPLLGIRTTHLNRTAPYQSLQPHATGTQPSAITSQMICESHVVDELEATALSQPFAKDQWHPSQQLTQRTQSAPYDLSQPSWIIPNRLRHRDSIGSMYSIASHSSASSAASSFEAFLHQQSLLERMLEDGTEEPVGAESTSTAVVPSSGSSMGTASSFGSTSTRTSVATGSTVPSIPTSSDCPPVTVSMVAKSTRAVELSLCTQLDVLPSGANARMEVLNATDAPYLPSAEAMEVDQPKSGQG
ncbi:hypothetical protein BC832DRAFT_542800 [Gaertneriomyces semiglobifer]|nr:hypothetical protein BC832DRAFT_542800 [Gaertneriomyces semiglobifer]